MSFSDDDIRIMKNVDLAETKAIYMSHSKLEALLARLEAAIAGFTEYHGLEMSKGCECRCCKAWRKAAGKDGV